MGDLVQEVENSRIQQDRQTVEDMFSVLEEKMPTESLKNVLRKLRERFYEQSINDQ